MSTEHPDEAAIGTLLARMDGKIDLLSHKLDAHKDLLMAEMRAGDRESGQAIALTNARVTTMEAKVKDNANRITTLEDAVVAVPNLTKLVYGFVALCLVALMSGVLSLVLRN